MIKRVKEWMHWKGVTIQDVVYGTLALGFLTTFTTVLIYALVTSVLG